MELVGRIFEEHAGTLTEALSTASFSTEQAASFLPETASIVIVATDGMGYELNYFDHIRIICEQLWRD